MDNVVDLVLASDANSRQQAYDFLFKLLDSQDAENTLASFDDYNRLFDGIAAWISSSSLKNSLHGLDLIERFALKLGERLRPFAPQFINALFDRLGDNKEQVRVAAHDAIAQLMETVCAAQFIFDHVPTVFQSRQPRIREEVLSVLRLALERYGGGGLVFSKMMPSVSKLLDDPVPAVREGAMLTLVLAYRTYGERVKHDLIKKNLIPPGKLPILNAKFEEAREDSKQNGENEFLNDSADGGVMSVNSSGMSQSVHIMKRTGSSSSLSNSNRVKTTIKKTFVPSSATSQSALRGREDGSVDSEIFQRIFEESIQQAQKPTVSHKFSFSSPRELVDVMSKIRDFLSDSQADWERRVESARDFRYIVVLDGSRFEEFWTSLRNLEIPFQNAVKDLRSQLVREACISVSFLTTQLGDTGKLDRFAEAVLPSILQQMANSAKIMATSAVTCAHFVVSDVQTHRLIPIIAAQLAASKSATIRKHCYELVENALAKWPTRSLDKQVSTLVDIVKRGLTDADQEARAHSRQAFWQLKNHFPNQADHLYNQLDSMRQKVCFRIFHFVFNYSFLPVVHYG